MAKASADVKRLLPPVGINSFLDGIIRSVYSFDFFRKTYHPYLAATDLGKIAMLAAGVAFVRTTGEVTVGQFAGILVLVLLTYRAFTEIKGRVFGIWSRSYLQDLAVCIIPSFCLLSLCFGVPLATAMDLLGFVLPCYLGFIRIGCFLGGCCYGIPYKWGVKYDAEAFTPVRGLRNFSPGTDPQVRVLPTQILESFFNLVIFLVFYRWILLARSAPKGSVFFVYMASYCLMRFGLDFFRGYSSRPRVGPFSEAQIFAALFAASSLLILFLKFG